MSKTKEIVEAIESVLPKRRPIEHHEPFINKKKASIEIANCLASGVQNYKYVELFENWLKDFTDAKYVLCTNTGTAALHVSLIALGIKPGDEVIVPTTTFVATANSVVYCGAIPHFIDGAPTIDPVYLRNYISNCDISKIKAIIVVHLFGNPADIEGICQVANDFNLIVVEDASQALGTKINDKHVGTFGLIGTYSFNNNKIITCNGGGAITTNDENIYYVAKQLSSTARKPHKWLVEHHDIAFNYKMSNICAAIGLSQAQEFNKTLALKQGLALRYRRALKDIVQFVEPTIQCEPNNWLNTILVDDRDELLEELHNRGVKARASFTPIHLLDFYRDDLGSSYEKALNFFSRAVCLPSGANL